MVTTTSSPQQASSKGPGYTPSKRIASFAIPSGAIVLVATLYVYWMKKTGG